MGFGNWIYVNSAHLVMLMQWNDNAMKLSIKVGDR